MPIVIFIVFRWILLLPCYLASATDAAAWTKAVISLLENEVGVCNNMLVLIAKTDDTSEQSFLNKTKLKFVDVQSQVYAKQLLYSLHNTYVPTTLTVLEPLPYRNVSLDTLSGSDTNYFACAVVAILYSSEGIFEMIDALESLISWTPRAPHLMVLNGNDTNEEVKALLLQLWKHRASRTAVLQIHTEDPSDLRVIWGYPFVQGNRCLQPDEASVRSYNISGQNEHFVSRLREKMYPPKGIRTFHQCIVKLSAYPWTAYTIKDESIGPHDGFDDGIEVRIIHEIARKMDFVYEFLPDPSDYGATGMQVINGTGDVALGALILMDGFFPELDPSESYCTEPIVWWVPRGAPVPRSLAIAFVFSARLWLFVAASVAVVLFGFTAVQEHGLQPRQTIQSNYASKKLEQKTPNRTNAVTISKRVWALVAAWLRRAPILWVFVVLLCGSVPRQPTDDLYRVVFLVWVLGAFIINTAYQSALVGFLANPGTFHEIQDVDELLASNLVAGLSPEITEVLSDVDDPKYDHIMSHARVCQEVTRCLDRAAFSRDMAIPMDKSFVTVTYESTGRSLLKPLATVSNYNIIMYLAKHSALVEAFNEHVRGLVEGGFVDLWWNQLTDGPWNQKPGDPGPQVMTLSHLQGAFLLLTMGLATALLCFLCEVTPSHCRERSIVRGK